MAARTLLTAVMLASCCSLLPAAQPSWLRLINEQSEEPSTLLRWSSDEEASGGPAGADEPLSSDRPDFTEASNTVGRGVSQIEMGYTYAFDDGTGIALHNHSCPELLVRQGMFADWFELRLGWSYLADEERGGGVQTSSHGSDDLYLGTKLGLTPQQGIWPEMSITPQMTVPLGSDFTAGRVLPGVNWLYGWELSECLSTGGSSQLNLAIDTSSDREYTEFAQSWTIGYSLTERLGAYTEWFVLVPAGADTARTEHYIDGGFTWNWSNDLQFDVRYGKGLSSAATDYFTGAGMVVRF